MARFTVFVENFRDGYKTATYHLDSFVMVYHLVREIVFKDGTGHKKPPSWQDLVDWSHDCPFTAYSDFDVRIQVERAA